MGIEEGARAGEDTARYATGKERRGEDDTLDIEPTARPSVGFNGASASTTLEKAATS
jgi:hypothetical protein